MNRFEQWSDEDLLLLTEDFISRCSTDTLKDLNEKLVLRKQKIEKELKKDYGVSADQIPDLIKQASQLNQISQLNNISIKAMQRRN